MGDRTRRIKGKIEEVIGRAERDAGFATAQPGTEAREEAKETKGKGRVPQASADPRNPPGRDPERTRGRQDAVGKARSAVKKNTR
jgi:uncharacterized protein YjbJ (UPF0337 family)